MVKTVLVPCLPSGLAVAGPGDGKAADFEKLPISPLPHYRTEPYFLARLGSLRPD
jgi:hypothetical protein